MEFIDVLKSRNSTREYFNEEIKTEILKNICNLSLYCPSASNIQAWRLVIVNEKENLEKIKKFTPGITFFPPSLIMIGMDKEEAIKKGGKKAEEFIYYDAGIIAYNITLVAKNLGYDSCIIGSINKELMRNIIGFPINIIPMLMVVIGKAKENNDEIKEISDNNIFLQKYS